MTAKQIAYSYYLKSPHWTELRQSVLIRDKSLCQNCGRPGNIAHHRFYRRRFEDSMAADLVTLCEKCHESVHHIEKQNGKVVSMVQMPGMRFYSPKIPINKRRLNFIVNRNKRRKKKKLLAKRFSWSF